MLESPGYLKHSCGVQKKIAEASSYNSKIISVVGTSLAFFPHEQHFLMFQMLSIAHLIGCYSSSKNSLQVNKIYKGNLL